MDPSRGGSITEFFGGGFDDQWLLHEPSRRAAWPDGHSAYDDVWSGGFEELFPNDAPVEFEGRALPDHGELWNSQFEVVSASPTRLRMLRRCSSMPVTFEKSIELNESGSGIDLDYRITNHGEAPVWYLFKLHAAMRVEAGDSILLPGGIVSPVEPGFGVIRTHAEQPWPFVLDAAQNQLDLSAVRDAKEQFREFVYVANLPEGWCGLRRARTGESFRINYQADTFPWCWLFITYGGWRDYNTVVLEPCTNYPKDLVAAKANGTCAMLSGGDVREIRIAIAVEPPRSH